MFDGAMRPAQAAAMTLTGCEPSIFTADFARARRFYIDVLGFRMETAWGEPPFYGILSRGAVRIALRHVDEPVFADDVRAREQLLSASFTVASGQALEGLFAEFSARGADVAQPLKDEAWDARTFILRDPDGNLLLFAAPASQ
jgi:catechol 2,3-dioxygenase-like lactoylglutathione lyase family enzyme